MLHRLTDRDVGFTRKGEKNPEVTLDFKQTPALGAGSRVGGERTRHASFCSAAVKCAPPLKLPDDSGEAGSW